MDIEAIVKKYFDPHAVYMVEGREAMRSALTELADWHEQKLSSAKLEIERLQLIIEKCGESDLIACRKINEANERIRQLEAERVPAQQYTTGHCANKAQPGGCQLHNLHCNYPICDRRPAATQPKKEGSDE